MGYRIKLLAIAKKRKNTLDLRVHPAFVSVGHPLSDISLAYNAVCLETRPAGELLFYGAGAGGVPTSSSVVSDIVNIALNEKKTARKKENIVLKDITDIKSRYYIRCMIKDKPGVLARVSEILASFNISIATVNQKEDVKGRFVPLIMVTHEAKEGNLKKAIVGIDNLSVVRKPSQIIRIENL